MADVVPAPQPDRDRDLASVQQARSLARLARSAQVELGEFSQEQIDRVVDAMVEAVVPQAEALARLAHEETGFGNVADKLKKNLFASVRVHEFIRPLRTVGVVRRHDDRKVIEIAEPFGVVAAIVPSTNPTSTAIYNTLIAIKARCAIVLSPHPSAERCIIRTAEILSDAARGAGAPEHAINWMTGVTLEGTQELMKAREIAVILATGGMGLVRAAYSAGKPAYGVGPGNAPAYIERTADVRKAARDVMTGKTFDNGVLCSSENSVVVDAPVADAVRAELRALGAHFLSPTDSESLARLLVTPQRLPNPACVGRDATVIARLAGISVPATTRVLIAELDGVGRDHPLSIEKLCPVLSFYVVKDWREGCERCKQILRYGGMGHTMAIHSSDEEVILQFGLHKPAFRVIVNSPTTFGSIGMTTGLDPALTLGCGGFGGNITSDNITPLHLLNIKRVAYEVRAAIGDAEVAQALAHVEAPAVGAGPAALGASATLGARVGAFLTTRGISPGAAAGGTSPGSSLPPTEATGASPQAVETADFVCEDDVRQAIRAGRKIHLAVRAIVTPAARDLGKDHDIFVSPPALP